MKGKRRNGKEYDDFYGKLEYEGEYLNGEYNGKGKQYNKNGNLYMKENFWMEKEKNMIII